MKKLFLLSGFLGAGKTTFLKRVVNEFGDKKIAIIINEFAKISIDAPIISDKNVKIVEINAGSIYCSCLKLSFIQALNELAKEDVDYVFVEPTGLADHSNIGEIMECVKVESGDAYEYAGAICIIDGYHFASQISEIEAIERQIMCSNIAIISKVDLVTAEHVQQISAIINDINPEMGIYKSTKHSCDMSFLNEGVKKYNLPDVVESLNKVDNKPKTISIDFDGHIELDDIKVFFKEMTEFSYRMKGFINTREGSMKVDIVGGVQDYEVAKQPFDKSTVIIISKIGPQIIRKANDVWKAHIQVPMKMHN